MKKCSKCGIKKTLSEYYSNGRGGLESSCKKCVLQRRKANYQYIKSEPYNKKCIYCGALFTAISKNRRYCGKPLCERKRWNENNSKISEIKCRVCGTTKDLSNYYKKTGYRYGYSTTCKSCLKTKRDDRSKKKKKQMNLAQKRWRLNNQYGISLIKYKDMLHDQNNKCAICGKEEMILNKSLSVDHDHASGKVRGLLCTKCNMGLGKFNDDIEVISHAVEYLRSHLIES